MAMSTTSSAQSLKDFKPRNILMAKNSNAPGQENPNKDFEQDIGFMLMKHNTYKVGDEYGSVRRKDAYYLCLIGHAIPSPSKEQILRAESALKVQEENAKAANSTESLIAATVAKAVTEALSAQKKEHDAEIKRLKDAK